MSAQTHRKQVLLFILAVLLPSLFLTALTWRMIRQEQELAGKRLADERSRAARELGRLLLARLEMIKLKEAGAVEGGARPLTSSAYRNPEVVLIGLVDNDRLLLPWEIDRRNQESRRSADTPAYAQAVGHAEHEEFVRGNLSRAADLYRRSMTEARDPVKRGHAQLSLARTLLKLGLVKEAAERYRNMLALPPSVADEYGVPLSLYAARSLIERRIRHADVLSLVRTELRRKEWKSPAASYLLRDLVDAIAGSSPGNSIDSDARASRENIHERIGILERALSLQRDLPGLGLAGTQGNHERGAGTNWVACGSDPWLLSLAPSEGGSGGLLLVVAAQAVLASLRSDRGFRDVIPARIGLLADEAGEGFLLGSGFRNLRVAFVDEPQTPSGGWVTMRSFYVLALLLVLSVTSFGAYLLWRDVRREVQTAEMRSQFVSSVSHELKTPLTAIRMFAETLSLGRSRSPEFQREYLETIVNESERLTRLLNNVLDFSKIDAGRMAYRLQSIDLSEAVIAAVRTMQYPLSQQGFNLNLEIEDGVPAVKADRDAVEQTILNLLSNAIKYSGDSRDIELRLMAKDGQAVIQVTDHGLGIDQRERKRIFEKFYRVRSAENDRTTGSGLGLALVDHVVRAHGGWIRVESTPGKGSTFSIYLPTENAT